ncbi:heme-binding domain-containing protein [Daejeonella lutea]|uniref:Haem-binding domain-containing protein n=1 Tax=Daejeonella lutea TaxID=572036 RepID=A0A1T5AE16_9SPHI|nr:heme-binding domain-containing protein [Daejeonella lutea]SKB33049.1 Haem-binding domain-containing protein [Daejeonella lutea]
MLKKILLGLLVILVLIQFIRPAKNQSNSATPDDIFNHYQAPDSIKTMIKTSCYDCHSDNTNYPWYSEIQPVAWWLDHHIEEGRNELNFSDFEAFNARFKSHKLDEVMDEVESENMPLKSYLISHQDAKLTVSQREAIVNWANQVRNIIKPRDQ